MGARSALMSGVAASADPSAVASAPGPGGNVRVPAGDASQGAYQSADQLSGDSNIDAVLGRCGHDRRMQNELNLPLTRATPVPAPADPAMCAPSFSRRTHFAVIGETGGDDPGNSPRPDMTSSDFCHGQGGSPT